CYFAGEIILPIVLAFVLNLVLQPLMRPLEKLHLPRSLAALAIIMVLGGSIIGIGAALSGPAISWAQKLPEGLPRLQERLSFLKKPIDTLQKFLHHYVPILGPMIGVTILVFAGLLSIETLWLAFVTAGVYVLIHVVEGETITPMLLAKRFTINPVLVILSLVFWYWMWGILGAILAVPMLAVTKIVCDRIEALASFGSFF